MSEYTTEEALAFVEAMRLALNGKVGFKWHVERLARLETHIENSAEEIARLNEYLDETGTRSDYEAYLAQH